MKFGRARLADFSLAEGIIPANQGSFGAVPNVVDEAQRQSRSALKANPSRFFRARYSNLVRAAAAAVPNFLGGTTEGWVFVDNTTAGVNAVAASLARQPGPSENDIIETLKCWLRLSASIYNELEDLPVAGRAGREPLEDFASAR